MSQSDHNSAAKPDHDPTSWLRRFVDLLLDCPTMQTPAGRREVLTMLPGDLPNSIGDQNETNNRLAVTALARGCAGTEGGITALREVLAGFDGSTTPFKAVTAFLEAHPVPPPTEFPQDTASREAAIRNISIGTGTYNEGSIQATIESGIGVVGSTVNGNITYNDYRQGGPAQPARSPLVPPAPPEHFAGRERELKELAEMLRQNEGGRVALTALRGQGGIGKTTLARQLAYQLYTEKVFGAVLWVEVKPKFDPWPVLRRWAVHCGVAIDEANPDWPTVANNVKTALGQLTQGRALVVFDDVWADGVAGVRQLREALPPAVTLLTTSRDARVGVALKARRVEVGTLPTDEAVALLRVYLDDKELPQEGLEELAERLKGHALALTLAAKRLNRESHPVAALPRHLRQYAQGLPTGSAVARLQIGEEFTEREDSLALALTYSYDTLTDDQQARFRTLGALAYDQPFDVQILLGLWEALAKKAEGELAEETAREWAEELRDFSLVEAATEIEQGDGWYTQHPILHSYAAALLHENLEEETAACDHYYDWATTIAGQFYELRDKPEEWGFLTPYLPHIHTTGEALHSLHQSCPGYGATASRALDFAINVYWYLYRRQEVHKREWLEMGLEVAQALYDRLLEGWFLSGLAHYYDKRGHKTEALEYFRQALVINQEQNDQENEAFTLNNIGMVYCSQSDYPKALEYFEQALSLLKTTTYQKDKANTLNNIGVVYKYQHNYPKALEYFEQALSLLKTTDNRVGEAFTLNNIGMVYCSQNDYPKALYYLEQAFSLYSITDDQEGKALALSNIGVIYVYLNDYPKALHYLERAFSLYSITGDQEGEAHILSSIGVIYVYLNDYPKALHYLERALPLRRATGDRYGTAYTLNNMGVALWEMGQQEEGLQLVEQAQKLFEQIGLPDELDELIVSFVAQLLKTLGTE